VKRQYELPELLAPAGDFSALVAAVSAGADAVYVGGKKFGARAYAKNFDEDELKRAVRYCHIHGVRLYVTLNTLITDKELDEAVAYAEDLHKIGADALIVADLGVAVRIRETVPDLELHASTQMGIHNSVGADEAARLGITRVVLARECTGKDIGAIVEKCLPECEIFVHGALCVCHSGQCLFSSLVGGRSGNRGECAQPCRLPYGKGYPLSLSDLSLSEHIKEIVASGVSSLKIEGRMKSADYVYEVVSVYRRLLDENRNSSSAERRHLAEIFSRGGFTDGYFINKTEKGMLGVRTDEDKRISKELSGKDFAQARLKITAKASFKLGEPSSLTLYAKVRDRLLGTMAEHTVSVAGDEPSPAINAPLEKEALAARLAKMGNTDYLLNTEDIEIILDEGINLSPSAINALRRSAAEALDGRFAVRLPSKVLPKPVINLTRTAPKALNTAVFFKGEVYRELKAASSCHTEIFDMCFIPLCDISEKDSEDMRVGAYIPPVIMESEWEGVLNLAKRASDLGVRYALIGNISHIELCKRANLIPVADFRLNITNTQTYEYLMSRGTFAAILSPELTLPMARDIGGGEIVLGRVPLMLTERCFIKDNFGCDCCDKAYLTDRRGKKFPIMREYLHRNIIFNSTITYMGDRVPLLERYGISHRHFIFSTESAKECAALISDYKSGKTIDREVRRIGRRDGE